MTKTEIEQKYLALHNALGSRKEAKDKAEFDRKHAQIWANCDKELAARKAELKKKPVLSQPEQLELAELTELFPDPGPPKRDLPAELDELKARIARLHPKV